MIEEDNQGWYSVVESKGDSAGLAANEIGKTDASSRLASELWQFPAIEISSVALKSGSAGFQPASDLLTRVAGQESGRKSPWADMQTPSSVPKAESASHAGRPSPWGSSSETPAAKPPEAPLPSWIRNSGKPAEPGKPVEPAKPAEPVKPIEPAKPQIPPIKPPEQNPAPFTPWKPGENKQPKPWTPPPLPPFVIPGENKKPGTDGRPEVPPLPRIDGGTAKVYELNRLDNRAADHNTPDAMVRVPGDFDPRKPINLVIYNHGWGSTAKSSFHGNNFDEQMKNAPPNTVLIVPEWQRTAGASNGDQGRFKQDGLFRNMLQEIFNKTAALNGKTLNDVANIDIFSHSAGYGPSETEIYKNGLGDKVRSIVLLDSNYDETGFDSWLQANIKDLASGKKQFYNIFNGTAGESKRQAERLQKMFTRAGLPPSLVKMDYNNPNTVLEASTIAQSSIIFKRSEVAVSGTGPHNSLPKIYIGPFEAAARMRK